MRWIRILLDPITAAPRLERGGILARRETELRHRLVHESGLKGAAALSLSQELEALTDPDARDWTPAID